MTDLNDEERDVVEAIKAVWSRYLLLPDTQMSVGGAFASEEAQFNYHIKELFGIINKRAVTRITTR